jgi:hypothetical protein
MAQQFDRPAVYEIRVAGVLNESWSEYLSGMAIVNTPAGQQTALTEATLTGRLEDQAALLGVLNTLYDFGYLLLQVHYVRPG